MLKLRRSLFGALILALLLPIVIIDWPTSAQDEPVAERGVFRADGLELSVKAGFDGLGISPFGNWVPFRITITNQGEPITGRLVVHTETGPGQHVHDYVKDIQLPTGSRQAHEITAFLSSRNDEPVVRIETSDRIVAETRITVARRSWQREQLQVGVIDTDSSALNNINAIEIIRPNNREPFKARTITSTGQEQPDSQSTQASRPQGQRSRRGQFGMGPPILAAHPIVVSPDDMPRDHVSYDPLDVVVIGEAPLSQLSEDQARALRMWVAGGGLLVVTGGADFAGLRQSGLEAILPVEAQAALTSSSLPEMTDLYGRFEAEDPLLVMTARPRAGTRTLIGSYEKALVAEKNYGSGLVRWLAINPKINPYRGWGGAKSLWIDLLLPAAESEARYVNWITFGRRGNSTSNSWGIQNFLFTLAEIEPPSSEYFLLFLVAYILAVGPLNYLVLKWMGKTDLAWLTIPAVVILFTIVSVAVAQITRGGSSMVADVSLVELHQQQSISRTMAGLLIMPSSKGTHQVGFDGRDTFVNHVIDNNAPTSASAAGGTESERAQNRFLVRLPLTTWTSSLLQVRSVSDSAPALIEGSESSAPSVATIKNLGDSPIKKAVYLSSTGVSDVFEIAPGEQQQVSLKSPQPSTFNAWYTTKIDQDSPEGQVFEELASLLDRVIGGESVFLQGFFDKAMMDTTLKRLERPLLIGFIDKSPTEVDFRGSTKRRSKSFYVVHL